MLVKIKFVDNFIKLFNSEDFTVSISKEFYPTIMKLEIYDNGKKIFSRKRLFGFFYKHFTFKTAKVQDKLKELEKQNKENTN